LERLRSIELRELAVAKGFSFFVSEKVFSYFLFSVLLLQQLGCDESIVGDSGTAAAVAHPSVRQLLAKRPSIPPSSPSLSGQQQQTLRGEKLQRGRALTQSVVLMSQEKEDYWKDLEELDKEVIFRMDNVFIAFSLIIFFRSSNLLCITTRRKYVLECLNSIKEQCLNWKLESAVC
jgi:hypothetical protein